MRDPRFFERFARRGNAGVDSAGTYIQRIKKPRDHQSRFEIRTPRALQGELVYRDPGADAYDAHQRTRVQRRLRQRAATLGFDLLNRETGEILAVGVS